MSTETEEASRMEFSTIASRINAEFRHWARSGYPAWTYPAWNIEERHIHFPVDCGEQVKATRSCAG